MMTHKITLPDGTLIEIFTNADEVGQADVDMQTLFYEADCKVLRKMQLEEQLKQKAMHRKKKRRAQRKQARRKQR